MSEAQQLLADIGANEDAATQLAKRPRGDEADRDQGQFSCGHFPLKLLSKWVEHEDMPHVDECEKIAGGEFVIHGVDPDDHEDVCNPELGCKLGGWPYWLQGS